MSDTKSLAGIYKTLVSMVLGSKRHAPGSHVELGHADAARGLEQKTIVAVDPAPVTETEAVDAPEAPPALTPTSDSSPEAPPASAAPPPNPTPAPSKGKKS